MCKDEVPGTEKWSGSMKMIILENTAAPYPHLKIPKT